MLLHQLQHRRADLGRRRGHADAGGLHRLDLVASAALAARDDRTGVAWRATWRKQQAENSVRRLREHEGGCAGCETR